MRIALIVVIGGGLAFGQAVRERPSFEVASVKAMAADDPVADYVPRRSGDRVTMHNVSLWTMISWAYDLTNPDYQLVADSGLKGLSDDYEIQAIAPGGPGDDKLRLMFQSLLEDRFHLTVHRETRELTAYDLVVAKGGPKLVASPNRDFKPGYGYGSSSSWGEFRTDGKHLVGKSASIEEMAVVLTRQMRAPVRDRTGIAGTFDFDVAFSTGVDGSEKPVLSTAIHDLGLSLEKGKGSFEVLVIDHLEKPAGN